MGINKSDIDELLKKRDVDGLINALGDEDEWVCWAAVRALGRIGAPAVDPLEKVVDDQNKNVRRYAIAALGEIGDKRVSDYLEPALWDEDTDVRWAAAHALGRVGGEGS